MATSLLHPSRMRHLFEIGWTQIEVPALVTLLGLKPDGGRLAAQGALIVAPLFQVAIDGGDSEHVRSDPEKPLRGVHPKLFEEADRLRRGEVTPLGVRGADLERRNDFAVAFHLGWREHARLAFIRPVQRPWTHPLPQRPI